VAEVSLTLNDQDEVLRVLGPRDQHLRTLRETLGIRITPRDHTLMLEGPMPRCNWPNGCWCNCGTSQARPDCPQ
jgi:phosphate starvation-inducible protein PhoH